MNVTLSASQVIQFIKNYEAELRSNHNDVFVNYIYNNLVTLFSNININESLNGSLNRIVSIDLEEFSNNNSGVILIPNRIVTSLNSSLYLNFLRFNNIEKNEFESINSGVIEERLTNPVEPPKVNSNAAGTRIFISADNLNFFEVLTQHFRVNVSQNSHVVHSSSSYPVASYTVKHPMEIRGELTRNFQDMTAFTQYLSTIKDQVIKRNEINTKRTIVGPTNMSLFRWNLDEQRGYSLLKWYANLSFISEDEVIDANYGVPSGQLLFMATDVINTILLSDIPEEQDYQKFFNDFNLSVSSFNRFRYDRDVVSQFRSLVDSIQGGYYR